MIGRRKIHAETDFSNDSQGVGGVSHRDAHQNLHDGVKTMQKNTKDKVVGILLTTLAAFVCSAIDYFLKQEE